MTDFKTPPLPQAPTFKPAPAAGQQVASQQSAPQQQTAAASSDMFDDNFMTVLKSKSMLIVLAIVCVIGMFLGSILFGSSKAPQKQSAGLQGVVRNQDITKNIPRCGLTDRGQACVLYIMNHTRYDKIAEEFFDDAVRLTEVQRYSIAIANPKYATTRIPPGHFAQIQIPNVR